MPTIYDHRPFERTRRPRIRTRGHACLRAAYPLNRGSRGFAPPPADGVSKGPGEVLRPLKCRRRVGSATPRCCGRPEFHTPTPCLSKCPGGACAAFGAGGLMRYFKGVREGRVRDGREGGSGRAGRGESPLPPATAHRSLLDGQPHGPRTTHLSGAETDSRGRQSQQWRYGEIDRWTDRLCVADAAEAVRTVGGDGR